MSGNSDALLAVCRAESGCPRGRRVGGVIVGIVRDRGGVGDVVGLGNEHRPVHAILGAVPPTAAEDWRGVGGRRWKMRGSGGVEVRVIVHVRLRHC